MTDDKAFYRLLVAEAKARLAKMSEAELIDLLISQHGQQMTSDLLKHYQYEERDREWNVRKPRKKRANHWRGLADLLWQNNPDATYLSLFCTIPWGPVVLKMQSWDGDYEFWRELEDEKERIFYKLDGGLKKGGIEFDGFKRHLRESKNAASKN